MTIINTVGGPAPKPVYVEAVEDTPSTLPHTYLPSEGYDYLSSVTVGADANLQAGNIKQGVSIFGVEGTLSSSGLDLTTIDPSTVRGYNSMGAIWCDNGTNVGMTEETGNVQVYYNIQGWGIAGVPGTVLFQGTNSTLMTYAFPYTKRYTIPTSFTGTVSTGGYSLVWSAGDELEGWLLPLSTNNYQANIMAPETEDVYVEFHATMIDNAQASITLGRTVEYVANDSWTSDVATNIRMRPIITYKVN